MSGRFQKYSKTPIFPPCLSKWNEKYNIDTKGSRYTIPSLRSSYYGICKYGNQSSLFHKPSWAFANDCVYSEFFFRCCNSKTATFEFCFDQLKSSSSNGTCWDIFQDKGKFKASPYALKIVNDYYLRLNDAQTMVHPVLRGSDKMEVRSAEKLDHDPPKVRLFIADPFERTVVSNHFSLDFNNKFYSSNCVTASGIGRSKYFGGYQAFAAKLTIFVNQIGFDVSSNDASQMIIFQLHTILFRWDCMSEEYKTPDLWVKYINFYLSDFISFVQMPDGTVLMKFEGTSSGRGNTLVDNTIGTYRLLTYIFAYCWFQKNQQTVKEYHSAVQFYDEIDYLSPKRSVVNDDLVSVMDNSLSYNYFNSVVSTLIGGDDCNNGVSQEIHDWFNPDLMAKAALTIGFVIKFEYMIYKTIDCMSFFSHNFVKLPEVNMYLPAPETSKIFASLFYKSGSSDVRWVLLRAFALRIESWANLECRKLINSVIETLLHEYQDELLGEVVIPGNRDNLKLLWKDIAAVYMNDDQLSSLYIGHESATSVSDIAFKHFSYDLVQFLDL